MPNTIETVLTTVPNEVEDRSRLLEAVTLTEQGVAVCENPISGVVMQLAAVKVSDASEAKQVPLAQSETGALIMPLPEDRLTKIGFFLSRHGYPEIAAAARVGKFPGQPLITTQLQQVKREAVLGMSGLMETELDEKMWAVEIGLFSRLGFNPDRTRGVFSQEYQPDPHSDKWESQRIVAVPKGLVELDLVETVGPSVAGETYQMLGFGITRKTVPSVFLLSGDGGFEPQSYTFGPEATRGATKGGFTTGFGRTYETRASTAQVSIDSLQAAFEVGVVAE